MSSPINSLFVKELLLLFTMSTAYLGKQLTTLQMSVVRKHVYFFPQPFPLAEHICFHKLWVCFYLVDFGDIFFMRLHVLLISSICLTLLSMISIYPDTIIPCFYGRVAFHCVDVPHLPYPSLCCRTLRLLPFLAMVKSAVMNIAAGLPHRPYRM